MKARIELFKHQRLEARNKEKAPMKMINIQHGNCKRNKDIPILLQKKLHSHNQMLMEALLLKGKDSPQFENVGPGSTMVEKVTEVVYKEYYK